MGHELSVQIITSFDVEFCIAVHWRQNLSNIEYTIIWSCRVNIGVKIQVKLWLKVLSDKNLRTLAYTR